MPITRWNTNYKMHVATTTTRTDAQIQIEIWMQPWGLVWVTCREDETQAPLLVIIKHQPASSSGENRKGSQTNILLFLCSLLCHKTPSSRDEKRKSLTTNVPPFCWERLILCATEKHPTTFFLVWILLWFSSCFLHFQVPCLASNYFKPLICFSVWT